MERVFTVIILCPRTYKHEKVSSPLEDCKMATASVHSKTHSSQVLSTQVCISWYYEISDWNVRVPIISRLTCYENGF